MNVMLCSSKFVNGEVEYNGNKIIELLKKKSEDNIDFLFFGESFLNGFDVLTWNYNEDIKMKKTTEKYLKLISSKCMEYNIGVGFGYFEFSNNKIYSSYIVFDNNGNKLMNYRRISDGWRYPNVDTNKYSEGLNIGLFEYKGKKIGVALCGDVWHESLYCELLNNDFDVFIWPVYVSFSKEKWLEEERSEYLLKSKSLGTHVLYINSVSDEPCFGGSYFQTNQELVSETKPSKDENCLLARLY